MTQRLLRTLSALAGLFFFALGLLMLFAPARQSGQFAIFATGTAGLSTLRGDFAGLFLGMAVFILTGAIRASTKWLAVPAVFLSFIILGRFLNLILDGGMLLTLLPGSTTITLRELL